MNELSIQTLEPNTGLMEQVELLSQRLEEKALEYVKKEYGSLKGYTLPEIEAMVELMKYKMLDEMEVIPLLVKARIASRLNQIWMVHPNKAGTKREFIVANGLSKSHFYDLVALHDDVLPLLNKFGVDTMQFLKERKGSNIREMLPMLKAVLTGEASQRPSVNNRIAQLTEEIKEITPNMSDEDVRREIASRILEASQGTNAELSNFLNPDPTPAIVATLTEVEGNVILLAEMDYDQAQMMFRLMKEHLEVMTMKPEELKTTKPFKKLYRVTR